MSLRIAIDARLTNGSSTGDSTYWTCLTEALATLEDDFHLLLYSNAPSPSWIPENPKLSWRFIPARSARWWSYVAFPLAAKRDLADVIHTQYSLSPLAGRHGVTTVHDVSFFINPTWFPLRHRTILRKTVPSSVRRASAVITVSHTSKKEIDFYIPGFEHKIRPIYNACPPWIQRVPKQHAREEVLNRFGIEGPYMLSVGTRWPRKNFALASEAARLLQKEMHLPLVITGKEGWGAQNSVDPGSELRVGYVERGDLSFLYSAASIYVLPSLHEGFGIPMLEAWRCGTPVLCSRGGALPEIAGDAAFVENSWNAVDWAARILSLWEDEGKLTEMRERGLRREAEFSWDRAARETLQVYREVADAGS